MTEICMDWTTGTNIKTFHGQLKHDFTQGKRTGTGVGGRAVSSCLC